MIQTSLVQIHREFDISRPDASRGSDGFPLIYFPASETKREIHQIYLQSWAESLILHLFLRCLAEVYAPHTIQHSPWWCLPEMRRINFQLSAWRCKFPVFHVTFWIEKMIVCSLRIKKCFENYYQIKKNI